MTKSDSNEIMLQLPDEEKTLIISFGDTVNVYIRGPICPETINPICDLLVSVNLVDPEDIDEDDNAPLDKVDLVNLFIDTNGGDLHDAFRLIDLIEASDVPVRTIGWGKVMSAGFIILMAGHRRLISKRCSFMTHHATYNSQFFSVNVTDTSMAIELNNIKNRVFEVYEQFTGKPRAYVKKHLLSNSDKYLTADQVIMHNVADDFIPSKGMAWIRDLNFLNNEETK